MINYFISYTAINIKVVSQKKEHSFILSKNNRREIVREVFVQSNY